MVVLYEGKAKWQEQGLQGVYTGELVVVLVILGVLVALAVPRFTASVSQAKVTTFCANVRTIKSQLELYRMMEGSYPTTGTAFEQFLASTAYFESVPVNPFTTATFSARTGNSGQLGYFEYTATANTYTVTTTPECDIVVQE